MKKLVGVLIILIMLMITISPNVLEATEYQGIVTNVNVNTGSSAAKSSSSITRKDS